MSDDCGRIASSRSGEYGNRRVECGDAPDGRVEIVEELARDPRGDLRAEPARQLILVRDDHAIGPLDVRGDGLPVVRRDRPQVEHRDADAILLGLLRRHAATAAPARPT